MMKLNLKHTLFLVGILFCFNVFPSHGGNTSTNEVSSTEGNENWSKDKIKEYISHHIKDSYSFNITHGVGFSLPVIIWDGGLKIFSSGNLAHGEEYKGYKIDFHGNIVSTEGLQRAKLNNIFNGGGNLFFDFSITKNVFVIILMSLFLIWLFSRMAKRYRTNLNPGGASKFLEPLVLFVRDEIARPNIGEKHYKRFMNYLLTIFFFIWFLNLAGMTPLGIGVTNNIAITFALALCTFLITQFSGNKHYWGHIFWMPGIPWPMRIILAPIELLGVFIKPFALMIRLYANMTAGHIVLMSIIGLIFFFKSWLAAGPVFGLTLFLSVLELLVAALQAYIFTMLSALYFGAAVEEHH